MRFKAKKVDDIIRWSIGEPGSLVIILLLTMIWFYCDYPSMEPVVGIFATSALLVNHYYKKQDLKKRVVTMSRKEKTPDQIKRAIWVGAREFDLKKSNEVLFDFYRRLMAVENFMDLIRLRNDFKRAKDDISDGNSQLTESYLNFEKAITKAIEVASAPVAMLQKDRPVKGNEDRKLPALISMFNPTVVYSLLLLLSILFRVWRGLISVNL